MSAFARTIDRLTTGGSRPPLRALAASGQLGYGIPEASLAEGLARAPHLVGCDMGSIDVGPAYLGSGRMATAPAVTRRDLRLVLTGARARGLPLVIGSAGTAGGAPHLEATVAMLREIARAESLAFRLATIGAEIPPALVDEALAHATLRPIGPMPAPTPADLEATPRIVAQMGTEAFLRAMDAEPDVIVAGRACDTSVFACLPARLGYPMGPTMHMAKIIECTSICCAPGGRDAMLGTLEGETFVLESMHSERHATPVSVAAHSLYEQADPDTVVEPEGTLHLEDTWYEPVDAHRCRVGGARWVPAARPTVKVEAAARIGHRAVLVAGAADPAFIASLGEITAAVTATVREIVPPGATPWDLRFRAYGLGAVQGRMDLTPPPPEVGVLVECIAATADEAKAVVSVAKQYLLHHGFDGRLSTGGNIAFPFTPPEIDAGEAWRFTLYHVMPVPELAALFPVEIEEIR